VPGYPGYKVKRILLLGFLYCLAMTDATADILDSFVDPEDGMFDASDWLLENAAGFMPVPIIITEPAVDNGAGLALLFFHESEERKRKRENNEPVENIPASVSGLFGAYTGNESWLGGGFHFGSWKSDNIRYVGAAGTGKINLDFYGLQEGSIFERRPLSYEVEADMLLQRIKFRLAESDFFIGADYLYGSTDLRFSLFEQLPPQLNIDSLGIDISRVGLGLYYESNDRFFYPEEGFDASIYYGVNDENIGSDYDYANYEINAVWYDRLSKHWGYGLRFDGDRVSGNAPFFVLPGIDLRGIPAARYQDKNVTVAEVEVRYSPQERWRVIGFLGAGRTFEESGDFSDASSQVSRGVGFRYNVAKKLGMFAGVDVARGPEDTVWYIQVGNVW